MSRKRSSAPKPRWDAANHTLFWGGKPIKTFVKVAPDQEALLVAFERRGWPEWLGADEVLAENPHLTKIHLRQTVTNLNRGIKPSFRFRQASRNTTDVRSSAAAQSAVRRKQ